MEEVEWGGTFRICSNLCPFNSKISKKEEDKINGRSWWVRTWILRRQGLWASHGLLREFAEDPDWYFNNFQMNEAKFQELEMITQLIQEKYTYYDGRSFIYAN